MKPPDWNEVERILYGESVAAIKRFSVEHTDEEVCYFAFDSEPYYGYVLICFDTTENSITEAKLSAERSLKSVREFIQSYCDWQRAKSVMISASKLPFTNNTGDFKYQGYAEVNFGDWQDFADSEEYPVGNFELASDYLEGNLVIVFWKVIDRLIGEGHFSGLRMASPFYAGYGFHDEDQILLRILNWQAEA